MSIRKVSDTEWEHEFPGENDTNVFHEVTATPSGLEVHFDLIPWEEIDTARAISGNPVSTRLIAIVDGYDACVEHLVLPSDMNCDAEGQAYRKWYDEEYVSGRAARYIEFSQWLVDRGARRVKLEHRSIGGYVEGE